MRTARFLVIILLLIAPAAFAQQRNDFSVFISNLGMSSSQQHSHWYADYGVALDTSFTPRLSAQLSVTSEQHHTYPYVVDSSGYINQVAPVAFHTYPIDLTGRYHLFTNSRWKPFLGAGLRYVAAPRVDSQFGLQSRLTPEAVGGVMFQMQRIGIVFEGKQLLGDREYYDSMFKASVGLNWRF
jgi:outer membrane protein W